MANAELGDEADKPLDPATERLRRKMVRLLVISIGVTFAAVMAVLAAVVYKITTDRSGGDPTRVLPIEIPAGSLVEDMATGDGEMLLRLRENEVERILRIDLSTGRVLSRYELKRP
ncbi:fimbrial protein [Aureimonas psammosilenae]|jgi:hypothetical protein|uniref:fimbrial protein n=1 Tax=Aureimonas psammosilenae TaxID=2495496 RepID=UPI001260D914|nr:fimbrial protein [Aureimonas psammosilenae]